MDDLLSVDDVILIKEALHRRSDQLLHKINALLDRLQKETASRLAAER